MNELKHLEDKIEGHDRTLYGEEGITGIVGMLSQFVTKRIIMKWAGTIVLCIGGLFAYMWADWRSFPETYAKDKDLKIVEQSIKGICEKVGDVKDAIDSHSRESLIEVREIRREILEILKSQVRQENHSAAERPKKNP